MGSYNLCYKRGNDDYDPYWALIAPPITTDEPETQRGQLGLPHEGHPCDSQVHVLQPRFRFWVGGFTALGSRLLGGSWVAISGTISPLLWVIIMVTVVIAPLTSTHEPK